jgi:hypothetical protein
LLCVSKGKQYIIVCRHFPPGAFWLEFLAIGSIFFIALSGDMCIIPLSSTQGALCNLNFEEDIDKLRITYRDRLALPDKLAQEGSSLSVSAKPLLWQFSDDKIVGGDQGWPYIGDDFGDNGIDIIGLFSSQWMRCKPDLRWDFVGEEGVERLIAGSCSRRRQLVKYGPGNSKVFQCGHEFIPTEEETAVENEEVGQNFQEGWRLEACWKEELCAWFQVGGVVYGATKAACRSVS